MRARQEEKRAVSGGAGQWAWHDGGTGREPLYRYGARGIKRGSGIRVRNVNERIKLYFGAEYGLSIESEPDEGTAVKIHLPAVPYEKVLEEKRCKSGGDRSMRYGVRKKELVLSRESCVGLILLYLLSSTDWIIKGKRGGGLPGVPDYQRYFDDDYVNFRKGVDRAAVEYNVDVSFITLYEKDNLACRWSWCAGKRQTVPGQ